MRKRIGILVLCAVLGITGTAGCLPGSAVLTASASYETSGTWGEVNWSLDEEGTLTISGSGAMGEDKGWASSTDSPWSYRSDIRNVIIEDGVTSIKTWAFYACSGLVSVTIPASVTEYGSGIFNSCSSLTTVSLPEGMTKIADSMFCNCESLTSITIPEGVSYIGSNAFDGCTSLTDISIPASVTDIGGSAFAGTHWLAQHPMTIINHILLNGSSVEGDVVIPDDVTAISDYAFQDNTAMTSVTIPDSVTKIGSGAFSGCTGLTALVLPDTIEEIPFGLCEGCTGLTEITFPASVTSISANAYRGCTGLTSVVIPDTVTYMSSGVFEDCTSLASVTLPETLTTIGKGAFAGTAWQAANPFFVHQGVLYDASAVTGDVTVPENVTKVDSYAFAGNTEVTSVVFPANVSLLMDYVFNGCDALTSVTIENPLCRIADSEYTIPANTTICGYPGSLAENYAEKYGRTFVALEGEAPAGYTYEVFPLMAPFHDYFYVRTDNPDPYSFRFVDKDTVYGDEGEIKLKESLFADVKYEDTATYRVNGGYLFAGSGTDGGVLTLQIDTQTSAPRTIPVHNLSTGEIEYETDRNEIWVDLDTQITLPQLYDDVDYLIATYAEGSDFFAKMDAVQKGFSSICLYSGSYIRGEVQRKGEFWSLSNSPHVDQTFYIQSPYARSGNQTLLASSLYPLRYDSVGFPSMMGAVAKRLDENATYKWSDSSHWLIDVTNGGETKSYGGQGSGTGQGIDPDQVLQTFTFEEEAPGYDMTSIRTLLGDYAKLEVPDDVPDVDTLTWDAVMDTVGDGAWVRMTSIGSIFGGYSSAYAYLYDTGSDRSLNADPVGTGGSIYWWGPLGYGSDTWVDGRYIGSHEIWEPGAVWEEHPQSDIILTQTAFPEITYRYTYSRTYEDVEITETVRNVRFTYDAQNEIWIPADMDSNDYQAIVTLAGQGEIAEKYLDMVQLTSDEIQALGVDSNTNTPPMTGYIYDGTAAAGTPFEGPEFGLGDVNLDKTIDASDAADVLIAAARIGAGDDAGLTAQQSALADVNSDGSVNAGDAAVILSYAAELGAQTFTGTLEEYLAQSVHR